MKTETKEYMDGVFVIIKHETSEADNFEKMEQLRDVARPVVPIVQALNMGGGMWGITVSNHWFHLERDGGRDCVYTTTGVTISGHIEENKKFYFNVETGSGKYLYKKPEEFGEAAMRAAITKQPATIAREIERRILATAERYAEYCRGLANDALADDRHQLRLIEKYNDVFNVPTPRSYEMSQYKKRIEEHQEKSRAWGITYAGAHIEIPAFRSSKLRLEFRDLSEDEADTLMMWYKIMQDEKKGNQ